MNAIDSGGPPRNSVDDTVKSTAPWYSVLLERAFDYQDRILRVQEKEDLIVRLGVKDNNPTAYRPWLERAVTGA